MQSLIGKKFYKKSGKAFGEDIADQAEKSEVDEHFGEIKVLVQMYKGIPMQVKVTDGQEEKRFGLPEHLLKRLKQVQFQVIM